MKTASMFAVAFSFGLVASWTHAQDRRPSNWGGGPNGYDVTLDAKTKLSGASSVSLSKSPKETKHKFGTIVQAVDASKFAGKRLRYSGYIKSQNVTSYAGLWLRVDSSERGSVAFDNMQRRPITGTNDWYKYEIVLDIPEDGAMMNFGALLEGDGKIWIDDLSFEIVTDEVETTNEMIRPTNQKIAIPASLAKEPENLSFET